MSFLRKASLCNIFVQNKCCTGVIAILLVTSVHLVNIAFPSLIIRYLLYHELSLSLAAQCRSGVQG